MTQQQQPTHTPEPWEHTTEHGYSASIFGPYTVPAGPGRPRKRKVLIAQFRLYTDDEVREQCNANAARAVACVNACQNLSDPAAALTAAREALERCEKLVSCLTVGQVVDAGYDAIEASGLNPYCLNEGRAVREDQIDARFVRSALAQLKGEQP